MVVKFVETNLPRLEPPSTEKPGIARRETRRNEPTEPGATRSGETRISPNEPTEAKRLRTRLTKRGPTDKVNKTKPNQEPM